jgi:hypothetical protein
MEQRMPGEVENEVERESILTGIQEYPRRWLAGAAVGTLIVGTLFYHFVEGWKLLDSLYFCAMTLVTVGYGDFSPKTDLGKLFTVGYVFAGLGVIAAFIDITARDSLQRSYERGRDQQSADRLRRLRLRERARDIRQQRRRPRSPRRNNPPGNGGETRE